MHNAFLLACNANISTLGVVITFNDCIVQARDGGKSNPAIIGNFSADGECSGYIQGKHIRITKTGCHRYTDKSEFSILEIDALAKVCVIYGHLGIDSLFVTAAMDNKVDGIINAGMGLGYQPKQLTDSLIQASEKGIFIVRCSRTGQGFVNRDLKIDDPYGFIAGGSISPQKACILLSVALCKTRDKIEVQRVFNEY